MQIHPLLFGFPNKIPRAFAVERARSEERAQGLSNAKGSHLPSAERSLLKRETE
jgi:hypothetical protein